MDLQEVFDAGFDAVKEYVDASFATFERRLVALEGKYVEAVGQITRLVGVHEQVDIKIASAIDLRKDIEVLRGSIEALPAKAPELPDVPALIAQAVKTLPTRDDLATVRADVETLRFLVKELPAPEPLPDFMPIITDEVAKAISAIEKPKDGHSPTAEELLPLFKQVALDAVAAIPRPADGVDGANGKDGRDGLDAVKFFRAEDDHLLVSLSNGEVRDLGAIVGPRGEMGERGLPGDTGPTGPQGEIGQSGRDGRDAEPVTREIIMDAVESTKALHAAVQNYLEQNPPAPGRDGRDGKDGVDGTNGNDGAPGADGRDGVDGAKGLDGADGQKGIDGTNGVNGADGKDGRDGLDLVEFVRDVEGHLIGTLSNGTVKDLGQVDGKDGADGRDGVDGRDADLDTIQKNINEALMRFEPDVDLDTVKEMIDQAVARQEPVEEFAPDEVAASVSMAVKMLAERPDLPGRHAAQQAPFSIHMPEMKAPVVEVAAPIVNVTLPEQAKKRTRTIVKGHDASGRITEFEQEEI